MPHPGTQPKASQLKPCVYAPDPAVPPDHTGQRYCRCGQRQGHPRHTLPEPDPDQAAYEARRVGERPEGDA